MAKIRAMIGTGGSQPTETVLWTNSNPSSSFSGQTVNLTKNGVAESIQNYDYIKIEYENNTSANSKASIIMSVSDFISCDKSSVYDKCRLMLGYTSSGGIIYGRSVFYATDTTVEFYNARRLNGSGSTDNGCIPIKIIGIKY